MKLRNIILIILLLLAVLTTTAVSATEYNSTDEVISFEQTGEIFTNDNNSGVLNADNNNLVDDYEEDILSFSDENTLNANGLIETNIQVSNYSVTLSPSKSKFTISTLTAKVKTVTGNNVNTGSVSFVINKNLYNKIEFFPTSVEKGVASYNYNREVYLNPGIYTCTAYYEDYANRYNSSSCNFYLKVYSKTILTVNNISCKKGEIITLYSSLSTSMGAGFAVNEGYQIFKINSKTYIKKNNITQLSFNEPGLLKCTAKYVGESFLLNSSETIFYISIADDSRIIYELNSNNVIVGGNFNINYKVVDSSGNIVKSGLMTISDPNTSTTYYKYSAKKPKSDCITVSNNPGDYRYKIIYYRVTNNNFQVEEYLSSSKSFYINVYAYSNIITNTIKTSVNKQISITVNVKDHLGRNINEGEVKTTILGKTYTSKVTNGKATFTNVKTPMKIGTYTYTINYLNSTRHYTPSSNNIKIVCLHDVKITIKSVTGYQGKKIKLTTTIKDENGNKIKKGTVTFNINGKNYNAAIKNGIASVTIKYPKAKFLKTKSKIKGSYLYETDYYKSIYVSKVTFNEITNYLGSSKNFKVTSKKKPIKHKYYMSKYKIVTVPIKNGVHTFKRGVVSVITKKYDDGTKNVLYVIAIKNNNFMVHYYDVHYKKNGKWRWDGWSKLNEAQYGVFNYGYAIKADKIKIKYSLLSYQKIY